MKKKITIKDISSRLGLSSGTVSRVLNHSSLISNEKSGLILKTAREMGYEKRIIKRPVSRAILNIILFLPRLEKTQLHLFYDFSELIYGIRLGFQNTRINIITELNFGSSTALENRKLGDIDGVIFAFTDPSENISSLLQDRNIPCILLNRKNRHFNYISLDNNQAMNILFSKAKEKIAHPLPFYLGCAWAKKMNSWRNAAFLAQCKEQGITQFAMKNLSNLEEINPKFISSIKNSGFNWIVCFNDIVAVSFTCAALNAGFSIPQDLSITGFDNSPLRNIFPIKVDTIDLNVPKMSQKAGQWLHRRIISKEPLSIQLDLPARYILGNSMGSR